MTGLLPVGVVLLALNGPAATFTVLNTNDTGAGSFRQALLDANTSPGLDTITFQIPGAGVHSISPLSAFPPITDPVVIDGTTQPGYAGAPLIELNGSGAGSSPGLQLIGGNSTVRGLVINRFGADGIRISGAGTNVIIGNFIGTDPTGALARGNGQEGIWLNQSSGNLIGGTNTADRNVIGANGDAGIYVLNGSGNMVQGNFIGVSAAGTAALGNANNGVTIYNSPGNRIGGAGSGLRNVIAGNRASGIYLNGAGSAGNLIRGNYIGTQAVGTAGLSNAADGITLSGAQANLIGGTNSAEGNLISANGKAGVSLANSPSNVLQGNLIGTDFTGRFALGNSLAGVVMIASRSNYVGGANTRAGNVICGNGQDGVFISTNSGGNFLCGNYIGVAKTGTNALGNLFNGISLNNAGSNTIGGTALEACNVISGNVHYGIQIYGGASGNSLLGNYIGTDTTGGHALANQLSGIRIESGGNTVGGATPGCGNLISGNRQDGIYLVGAGCACNNVLGNFIGTSVDGTGRLSNGRAGIGIAGAPSNSIGLVSGGGGNVLSANMDAGIYLVGAGATRNQVAGNIIGADSTGTMPLGNALEGIYLESAPGNVVGGTSPGAGNLICGNTTRGVFLTNACENVIAGNAFGTRIDHATALPNTFHNVELETGASSNTVSGNVIAFAPGIYAGVRVRAGSTNNAILGNAIFNNGGLGIDLDAFGVTSNDICDSDTGANQQQNFPVLTQAVTGSTTGIRGSLNSAPNQTYRLQFFASPVCDSSGNGEGQVFLADLLAVTGPGCNATFVMQLCAAVPPGYFITATATDVANNTSEFSACVAVRLVPSITISFSSKTDQVSLSWTTNTTGFVLKETASLSPPVQWSTVAEPPVVTGGEYIVTVPVAAGSRFYGLSFE